MKKKNNELQIFCRRLGREGGEGLDIHVRLVGVRGQLRLGWRNLIYSKQQLQCRYNVLLVPRGGMQARIVMCWLRKREVTLWDRSR